jgi:hypothetical protein
MCEVSPEFVAEVVKALPKKEFWDYIPTYIAALTPAFALLLSYLFFKKQHIQSKDIKLIEMDVERLYNSADLFFEYADSIGLFYSMSRIKLEHLLNESDVPVSVEEKTQKSANKVYDNFTAIHKSIFLLRSIDENDVADLVEKFRQETIEFRKEINVITKWDVKNKEFPAIFSLEMIDKINTMQKRFGKEKEICLGEIAKCKKSLAINKKN